MPDTRLEPIATLCDSTRSTFIPGQQIEVETRDALPFSHVGYIGRGTTAIIEMVSHKSTNQLFALKTFRRYYGQNFENFKRAFKNEVSIMERLSSHVHIIQIRGTYIYDRTFSILLSPAANSGDLGAYLAMVLEYGMMSEHEITLTRAFGCLANGLAYIHNHTILHKDIKPQNILIHDGRVIYTDFGISFYADQQDTTTTGYPGAFTRRYCAPEVNDCTKRNRKSDVYSLGCVFVEILDVLEPEIGFRCMDRLPYFEKLDEVRLRLAQATVTGKSRTELLRICHAMLEPKQADRIDTDKVLRRITEIGGRKEESGIRYFCDDCLAPLVEYTEKAIKDELVDDYTALSFNAIPNADIVSSGTQIRDTSKTAGKKPNNQKSFPILAFGTENEPNVFQRASSPKTPRYYCSTCGELGHSPSDCSNESWEYDELYHKSYNNPQKCWDCDSVDHFARDCPNKCWICDEAGHQAKNCPNECDSCGIIGHPTKKCPNNCWTCGGEGHIARNCQDKCFICGRLGHETQKCKGKCHKCGKIGHWKKECADACFECGELGHWAAKCPSKEKKGRRGGSCFECGAPGHWVAQCPEKQRGWHPIFDQILQGPYQPEYFR